MKDPRKHLAAWLPGRALHLLRMEYRTGTGRRYVSTACGAPSDEVTSDVEKVLCRRCFRTKLWRRAWNKAVASKRTDP